MKMKKLIIVLIAIAIIAGAFFLTKVGKGSTANVEDQPFYTVEKGPLVISFTESGTIKARDQIIIKNEVEGRNTIITLIDEGKRVREGDLLIELDSSDLEERRVEQDIRVQNTESSFISAQENLAVAENKAKSDVDLAQLDLDFAKQDLEKYIEGEFPYELDKADADITRLEEELTRANEKLKWSIKLKEDDYISSTELKADEIEQKKISLNLELAKKQKELLVNYTYKRKIAQLESDVSQAEMALERVNRKARADVIQAEANLKAREAEYVRQKDRLEYVIEQISKTKIYAPADGLVIYATSAQGGGWRGGNQEPLDEGQEVRERQELIYLPRGNQSNAEISIHESNLKKTRLGLPVVVRVDALQGRQFFGTVERIAPLPDAQSFWMNPDLKVYDSEIQLQSENPDLRTGMSCQAEIIVARYQDVIAVPIQAVIQIGSEPHIYVQKGGSFEPLKVELGLDNNKMVHVISGIRDGDKVLLTPPLEAGTVTDLRNGKEDHSKEDTGEVEMSLEDKIGEALDTSLKRQQEEKANEEKSRNGKDKVKGRGMPNLENLTDEQKEALRKKIENMTPEERKKMREQYMKQQQAE